MNLTVITMSGTRWMTHIKALLASTAQPGSGSPELERISFRTIASEVWMAATDGIVATVARTADSVESDVDGSFSIDAEAARMTLTLVDYVADHGDTGEVMVSLAAIGDTVTIHVHSDDRRSSTLTTSSHESVAQSIASAMVKEMRHQDRGTCLIDADLLKTATAPLEGGLTVQRCVGGGLTISSGDDGLFTVIVPIQYSGPVENGPSPKTFEAWEECLARFASQARPRKEDR